MIVKEQQEALRSGLAELYAKYGQSGMEPSVFLYR